MGGLAKALRPLAGRPLLAHVLEALEPQCRVIVIGGGESGALRQFGRPVAEDGVAGGAGPLAGVLGGLDWLAAHEADVGHALSVAVDMPFLPADLGAKLQAARDAAKADFAGAVSGGRRHPVCALWPSAVRGELRSALESGASRKVGLFLEQRGCVWVEWPVGAIDPFMNTNTPADLARAEAILGAVPLR